MATSRKKARLIDLSGEPVAPMDHQAGGHTGSGADEKPYLLRLGQDRLLKVQRHRSALYVCMRWRTRESQWASPFRYILGLTPFRGQILQGAAKGDRELAFYQTVFPHPDQAERVEEHGHHGRSIPCRPADADDACACPVTVAALQPFVPRFHGVALVGARLNHSSFVALC